MKFRIFVKFLYWPLLGVKGLSHVSTGNPYCDPTCPGLIDELSPTFVWCVNQKDWIHQYSRDLHQSPANLSGHPSVPTFSTDLQWNDWNYKLIKKNCIAN